MNQQDFLGLSSQQPSKLSGDHNRNDKILKSIVDRVVSFPASQSLHASTASVTGAISTGLPQLDEAVRPPSPEDVPGRAGDAGSKGIPCGHVTEVFGPPGVGKTSLA
jgi:ATP-dependent Lon protease